MKLKKNLDQIDRPPEGDHRTFNGTQRKVSVKDVTVNKGRCTWCNQEVNKPRRTFCSDACVHEHLVRS